MSAQAAPDCGVYLCPWCGPCLIVDDEDDEDIATIVHREGVEHPLECFFEEEETEQ